MTSRVRAAAEGLPLQRRPQEARKSNPGAYLAPFQDQYIRGYMTAICSKVCAPVAKRDAMPRLPQRNVLQERVLLLGLGLQQPLSRARRVPTAEGHGLCVEGEEPLEA